MRFLRSSQFLRLFLVLGSFLQRLVRVDGVLVDQRKRTRGRQSGPGGHHVVGFPVVARCSGRRAGAHEHPCGGFRAYPAEPYQHDAERISQRTRGKPGGNVGTAHLLHALRHRAP